MRSPSCATIDAQIVAQLACVDLDAATAAPGAAITTPIHVQLRWRTGNMGYLRSVTFPLCANVGPDDDGDRQQNP